LEKILGDRIDDEGAMESEEDQQRSFDSTPGSQTTSIRRMLWHRAESPRTADPGCLLMWRNSFGKPQIRPVGKSITRWAKRVRYSDMANVVYSAAHTEATG
jgi:hypothetical protein